MPQSTTEPTLTDELQGLLKDTVSTLRHRTDTARAEDGEAVPFKVLGERFENLLDRATDQFSERAGEQTDRLTAQLEDWFFDLIEERPSGRHRAADEPDSQGPESGV